MDDGCGCGVFFFAIGAMLVFGIPSAVATIFKDSSEEGSNAPLIAWFVTFLILMTPISCIYLTNESKKQKEINEKAKENQRKAEIEARLAKEEAERKAAEEAAFRALTPQQHVAKAREYMRNESMQQAKKHIDVLDDTHPSKKTLLQELNRKQNEIDRKWRIRTVQSRKDYAGRLQTRLYSSGFFMQVSTRGTYADTLWLETTFADDPDVRRTYYSNVREEAEGRGFKKVVIANRSGTYWTYELSK